MTNHDDYLRSQKSASLASPCVVVSIWLSSLPSDVARYARKSRKERPTKWSMMPVFSLIQTPYRYLWVVQA